MKQLIAILFFLTACSIEPEMNFEALKDDNTIMLVLDELETDEIPKQIGQLTNVEELTIQLTRTEGEWAVYPPLSWFENREIKPPFRSIPDEIAYLKNLRSLSLVNLDIHALPSSFSELNNLEFLDLSFNKLNITTELPKLKVLKSLKHLRVYGNHFNEVEMQKFKTEFPALKLEYKEQSEAY